MRYITKSFLLVLLFSLSILSNRATAQTLLAGVAKVDITDRTAGPVNDPLFVKALVIKSRKTTAVLITVDAVAIGEIGRIKNDYLPKVRTRLKKEIGIDPENVLVNASHCHGIVSADVDDKTVQAVKTAFESLEPVTLGTGSGFENRIMENRRLRLKSGKEIDVRHAYALPPDAEIETVGPIDPQIGILRIDRNDGRTLAVVYNFACHPIQGVPSGGNTADIIGFASKVIEENMSEGTMAFFLQGCGGDINPINYKDVDHPRSAETLGSRLGLSTLRATRKIECKTDNRLIVLNESLELPRGDRNEKILALEAKQERLLRSLRGTSLNLRTFIPLVVKYKVNGDFPSNYPYRYLQEQSIGTVDLTKLDAENRRNMRAYIQNIHTMEELTRVGTNLGLLRKHQASFLQSAKRTVRVELLGVRVGDFILLTFPGELTVQIGLNLKKKSPLKNTYIAGYTNGYIYYAPTAEQMKNVGGAQEDSDCILAPRWQELFEKKAIEIITRLK